MGISASDYNSVITKARTEGWTEVASGCLIKQVWSSLYRITISRKSLLTSLVVISHPLMRGRKLKPAYPKQIFNPTAVVKP